jgi:hypothetical protein
MSIEPTDEQRRTVKAMSGFGVPHDNIATHIGIDPKTLRKHFREELDRGSIEATTKVAQSLFNMATQGNNVAAAFFWMKARVGWREKQEVQHSGEPVVFRIVTGVPRAGDRPETTEAEAGRWPPGRLLDQSADDD